MTSQFEYLLNAMENAAAKERPADHNYAAKRAAVLSHVAALESSVPTRGMSDEQFETRMFNLITFGCPELIFSERNRLTQKIRALIAEERAASYSAKENHADRSKR